MDIHSVQQCLNSGEWTSYPVRSSSDPSRVYNVLITDPLVPDEAICECESFVFRGHCKHQRIALAMVCGWHEGSAEIQTDDQRKNKVCPRCAGDTEWVMEAG